MRIRNDQGKEFKNSIIFYFYNAFGISHEFSSPKTPQQNCVVERKNCTLQEMILQEIGAIVRTFIVRTFCLCYR